MDGNIQAQFKSEKQVSSGQLEYDTRQQEIDCGEHVCRLETVDRDPGEAEGANGKIVTCCIVSSDRSSFKLRQELFTL